MLNQFDVPNSNNSSSTGWLCPADGIMYVRNFPDSRRLNYSSYVFSVSYCDDVADISANCETDHLKTD